MKLGSRLKDLRLANDLTLDELAARSEVTKGFLSQLERDLTSPNVSTLEDILEALGTNLTEFFSKPEKEQIVFKQGDAFVDEKEEYIREWIVPNAQKNAMEPIRLTLQPLQKSMEMECHEGEEFGYVLKGQVDLIVGNEKHRVKSKETFYLSGRHSHYVYNPTQKEAVILSD